VLIPTYNERENLPRIIARVRAAVPSLDVLVLDDNSPDGTGSVADELAASDAQVHVLHRAGKQGLGAAYKAGFAWALEQGYDAAVEMDADGSHQPEQLPSLLRAAEHADLVIGARWVKGGSVVNWPMHRKALSIGANIYTKFMLGLPVNDATGGFRVYRASALRTMDLDSVSSAGYGFQVDMTVALVRAGLTAVEVPIEFVEREIGESKMSGNIVSEAFVNVGKQGLAHRAGQVRGAVARLRAPREGRWHSA
jgi:dolichol-phosphate mannosyltransferase